MKRIFTSFAILFAAASMLSATETTITESFSQVDNFKMVTSRTLLAGDVCEWGIRYGRRNSDKVGATEEVGTWLQGMTNYGYLEMNDTIEGGIKRIAFNWGHGNENGYTVVLNLYKRGESSWGSIAKTWSHEATATSGWSEEATFDVEMKTNARIKFANKSVKTADESQPTESKGRVTIGDIHITPYLLYTKKDTTITAAAGSTFTNDKLIDNTDAEGSIVYTSSDTEVATIDAAGEVTVVAAGTTTISASWDGVITTYTLTIVAGTPTGIQEVKTATTRKFVENGQILFCRDGVVYDLLGNIVR